MIRRKSNNLNERSWFARRDAGGSANHCMQRGTFKGNSILCITKVSEHSKITDKRLQINDLDCLKGCNQADNLSLRQLC
jgi:hypothetical protein